jgi:hypothetical protein
MPDAHEPRDTPKCPTCGEMMIDPEGTFLCVTALAQSFKDEDGTWRREEGSSHPIRTEEVAYLDAHGAYGQFI